jgi:hypothetical protein
MKAQTLFVAGATIAVVAVIVVGLILNGPPAEVRRQRLDEQRIAHLTAISHAVDTVWRADRRLPESLDVLGRDARFRYVRPRDPVTGEAYEYRVTGAQSYELCANFDTTGTSTDSAPDVPFWNHGPGRHCFAFTAATVGPDVR